MHKPSQLDSDLVVWLDFRCERNSGRGFGRHVVLFCSCPAITDVYQLHSTPYHTGNCRRDQRRQRVHSACTRLRICGLRGDPWAMQCARPDDAWVRVGWPPTRLRIGRSILMAYKAVLSRTVVRVQMTFELGSVVAPTWVHTRNQCHYQQTSQHFDRYLMSW